MQPEPKPIPLDLIWGGGAIAKAIGKTRSATYQMLERGQIPGRKVGNQWCASRAKLREYFEEVGNV